jgi:hypothetical protein
VTLRVNVEASTFNNHHTETRGNLSTMPNQPVAGTEPDGQKPSTIVNLDIQEVAVDPEQTQLLGQEASGENPATPNTYRSLYLRVVRKYTGLVARTKQTQRRRPGLVARTKQTQRRHMSEASDEGEMQLGQSDEETRVTSASSAEEEGPVGLSFGSKEEGQNTQS